MSMSQEIREVPPIEGEDDEPQATKALEPGIIDSIAQKTALVAEPKNMEERLSWSRFTFAQQLVGWCIFLILVFSIIGHFFPKDDSPLITGAIDTLKLILTTALGFVFAKASEAPRN